MSQRYIGGLIYNPPGGFSGYFDGTGDYLTVPSNAAFAFGTGAYTVEAWVFMTGTDTFTSIVFSTASANDSFNLGIEPNGAISVSRYGVGAVVISGSGAVPLNTWCHISAVRTSTSSNDTRLYVNGTLITTGTDSTNWTVTSAPIIGGFTTFSTFDFIGYISNLRVVKGTAVYSGTSYTVPSGPLQAITNTSLLTCAYSTFRDGSSNNFTITVNGNTAVSAQNPFPQTQLPNPALGNQGNGVYSMSQYQALRSQNLWPAADPYFDLVTLMLHGNGTNGAQNNTFLDSSTNNFTITRNGNTTQGTFTPYGSNWSAYFNGSNGSKVDLASAPLPATGAFTFECFIFPLSFAAQMVVYAQYNASNTNRWNIGVSTSGIVGMGGNTLPALDSTTPLTLNSWNHFAITRDGSGNGKIFVNGVLSNSITGWSATLDTVNPRISGFANPSELCVNGYLSNLRITNTNLYTASFAVPTSPLTAVSGTTLLTLQDNRYKDNSASPITLTPASTSIQRFSPFNPTTPYAAGTIGGSGYFDGSGDYLVCGTAADWAFMSNSTALWSVEMWVYPTTLGSDTTLLDTAQSTTANVGMAMQINANRTVQVEIYRGSAGTYVVTGDSTSTLVANQWNHILATYDQSLASQNLKFYINGGSAETANKTANAPSSSNPNRAMTIATYGAGVGQFFTGYIGSMRISNVIRSSGVPTAPYTSDANTVLLTNYTNGGIIDNAMMNDLETVGNAQISTSVSKFGGGSMYFDGTGDWLVLPSRPPLDFGTGDFTIEFWTYLNSTGIDQGFIGGTASGAYDIRWVTSNSTLRLGRLLVSFDSTFSWSPVVNTWYHVALTRSGSSIRAFVNGVQIGTTATNTNTYNTAGAMTIGVSYPPTPDCPMNGYIDDLRITKGYARYTANFTPQRSQWQDQ